MHLMTPTFVSEIRRVSFCVDRPKYAEPAYFFRNSVKLDRRSETGGMVRGAARQRRTVLKMV